MDTTLKHTILLIAAGGFALGISGPAFSGHVAPSELFPQTFELTGGDVSCQDAINAINAVTGNKFPISPRPNITAGFVELLINNPDNIASSDHFVTFDPGILPVGAIFEARLIPTGVKNEWKIEDISTLAGDESNFFMDESQILDLPGFEIAILQRNNDAIAYYQINQDDPNRIYISPGSVNQSPNKVRICWAVGPSGRFSETIVRNECNNANRTYALPEQTCDTSTGVGCVRTAELIQSKKEPSFFGVTPFNLSACTPRVARWCDPALPAGILGHIIENSCNPDGTVFGGISSTVDAAGGGISSSFNGVFTDADEF